MESKRQTQENGNTQGLSIREWGSDDTVFHDNDNPEQWFMMDTDSVVQKITEWR